MNRHHHQHSISDENIIGIALDCWKKHQETPLSAQIQYFQNIFEIVDPFFYISIIIFHGQNQRRKQDMEKGRWLKMAKIGVLS